MNKLSEEIQQATAENVEIVYVDQGYTGERASELAAEHGIRAELVKHKEAKRGFVLLPRRWVVERDFAWASRFRRLVKDYERLPETDSSREGLWKIANSLGKSRADPPREPATRLLSPAAGAASGAASINRRPAPFCFGGGKCAASDEREVRRAGAERTFIRPLSAAGLLRLSLDSRGATLGGVEIARRREPPKPPVRLPVDVRELRPSSAKLGLRFARATVLVASLPCETTEVVSARFISHPHCDRCWSNPFSLRKSTNRK